MPACSFTRSRACVRACVRAYVRACVHSLDLAILIHPSLPPSLIVGSTLRCILVLQEQRGPRDALGHAAAGGPLPSPPRENKPLSRLLV